MLEFHILLPTYITHTVAKDKTQSLSNGVDKEEESKRNNYLRTTVIYGSWQ